jgi:predicted TIM-barrel fold metal-dependent hydrolase
MIFDAHAHIVSDDAARYPPNPLSGTVRPGDLDDPNTAERLVRLLDENGVERALLVQRAHIYGYDNSYVVDAAARYPDRFRAMCAIDALDSRAPERIRHWVQERGAIGIRFSEPHRGADTSWFDSATALTAWETAAQLGISVRLHLYRWNRAVCLPAIAALLERFPQTTVVLDHISNFGAEEGPPDYGLDPPLRALVRFPNLLLLLSTINLGNLAARNLPADRVIEHLVTVFGARRVLWGSDIGQSKGIYAEMVALATAAAAALGDDDQRQLLYGTGKAVYGW